MIHHIQILCTTDQSLELGSSGRIWFKFVFVNRQGPKLFSHDPIYIQLAQWIKVLVGKLTVPQVTKCPVLYETAFSWPSSQERVSFPYPKSDQRDTIYLPSYFITNYFNFILKCTPRSSKSSVSLRLFHQTLSYTHKLHLNLICNAGDLRVI